MITGKIKSKYIVNDIRFNSGYFLNEDAVNSRSLEENRDKCVPLDAIATVWNPPIFKRQFCQKTERAIPYCQSSDVTNALEGSDVYINKIHATKVGSVVEENQILVTGFGTIGNTRLINELSSGISYANNCCRIQANEDKLFGYIYAVMTSKYGRSQLNKNASGSVVRYIEAPGIKKTLIPNLPEPKQQEIHNLIIEASNLRVEANKLLREAVMIIDSELDFQYRKNSFAGKTKISSLLGNYQQRLDSPTYINQSVEHYRTLPHDRFSSVKSLGFKVFRPGIFKRIKVESKNGLAYIKGSELNKLNPFRSCEYLSKTKTPFLNELKLIEDQILFTCAGTVGDVKLISKEFEENDSIGSQDIIRIEKGTAQLSTHYLFAFFSTKFANSFVQSLKYGSVIERVEPFHVEMIPVYLIDDNQRNEVSKKVFEYKNLLYNAFKAEEKAIDLVEKEIESWQK